MRRTEAASVNTAAADLRAEYRNHHHRDLAMARRAELLVLKSLEPKKVEAMPVLRYGRPACHRGWREVR